MTRFYFCASLENPQKGKLNRSDKGPLSYFGAMEGTGASVEG
jgi:hypothetical protein